jgi:hypothetical protein
MLLFDNYIPPCVEKIIVLEKKKGTFESISEGDIPNIVFEASVGRFISREKIKVAVSRARETAGLLLPKICGKISFELFD